MRRPPRHLGIVGNRGKGGVLALLPPLVRWIRAQGRDVSLEQSLARGVAGVGRGVSLDRLVHRVDAVLVLGGDGTLLHAARAACEAGVPILGVNLGGLGFLTETVQESLYPALTRLFEGSYWIERRMMVEARVRRAPVAPSGRARRPAKVWVANALNDAVIHPSERSRVIAIDVTIGRKSVGTLIGDGLIVATPTGSTAYSLSAGGPIVRPTVEALLATPISPHTLAWRPLLVGARETLSLRLRSGHPRASLTLDGQITHTVSPDDEIQVRRGPRQVRLIVLERDSYYDVLRTKLAWAAEPRGGRTDR
jgi:NAD+ kinase